MALTVLLSISTALVATGCGAITGGDDNAGSDGSGLAGEAAGDRQPQTEDQSFPVGATFWHSGFQVEVTDATLTTEEDPFGEVLRQLVLTAKFTNVGADPAPFQPELAVVAAGGSYFLDGSGSELPSVPGGLDGVGTLAFQVDEGFDPATAHLLVGTAEENQAQVPLGAQGGELVDLAPSEPELTGGFSLELLDLTFGPAEVRADLPESHAEVRQGNLALTLEFTATSRKSGNWALHSQHFALILPSGTAVGPDASRLGSLSGNDSGVDTEDLALRFLVDDPAEGDYTLRYTPPEYWLGDDGSAPAEGTYDFTL
jgi:hypothetical protein